MKPEVVTGTQEGTTTWTESLLSNERAVPSVLERSQQSFE